ncbi:RNA-binding S4 domain-containing protein [Corynebacterium mendelii]|uniref:RNA-binding S4 domain-containing protein n=1 Tax=Corynebacterium mendelii TaxID=2765362 RepID=A0A939E271_9CORY|nr:RNA-binding S4 domain-containing protein [Corynebacterium mendelii]MBN9644418.1 RNA-binding S4 domain-containing protein [Corynebacterium mendelii]
MTTPEEVAVAGGSIKLGQFIKLAGLVDTGGDAKQAIAEGRVAVNGEKDTRRGKTLRPGDTVTVDGRAARVVDAEDFTGDGDDFFDETTADDDFDPTKWENL